MTEITFARPSAQRANGYAHSGPNLARYLADEGFSLMEDNVARPVGIAYGYPKMLHHLPAATEKRILFTMFESDRMPASWHEDLCMADVVIVPSPFCAETMRRSFGIDPMVVPLGIEHDLWPILERPRAANTPYTFLSYESLNVRKGFLELFEAWKRAFGDRSDVRLILKTARTENVIPLHEYPNIEVHKGEYSRDELLELLRAADCFVFPSRGEGFGHTPLEALSTGIPVIAPRAHGIATYWDAGFFKGVMFEDIPARYDHIRGEDVGNYTKVNVNSLAAAMTGMAQNRSPWGPVMQHKAHEYAQRWSYRQTAFCLGGIIRRLCE